MGIMNYNGSCIVAMTGKECVAIACDKRLGVNTMTTVSENFQKAFVINKNTVFAIGGLATDVQTLHEFIRFRVNLYTLREQREMKPEVFSDLVASSLYQRRFGPYFVAPVVAGLKDDGTPIVSACDLVGFKTVCNDFACTGSAEEELYGICEHYFKPEMQPDELFETISQCILHGIDRNMTAGCGATVYLITKDGIKSRELFTRMD